jgi:hypothetical protein
LSHLWREFDESLRECSKREKELDETRLGRIELCGDSKAGTIAEKRTLSISGREFGREEKSF